MLSIAFSLLLSNVLAYRKYSLPPLIIPPNTPTPHFIIARLPHTPPCSLSPRIVTCNCPIRTLVSPSLPLCLYVSPRGSFIVRNSYTCVYNKFFFFLLFAFCLAYLYNDYVRTFAVFFFFVVTPPAALLQNQVNQPINQSTMRNRDIYGAVKNLVFFFLFFF